MERAGEIFHTHMSAHALTLSLTYVKLSFLLFFFLTFHHFCPQPPLSSALLQTHLYFISVLFTYSHHHHSLSFFLPSLISVCLMPCQSEQPQHQHTERVQERQEGEKTRQIQGDTRRPRTSGAWLLIHSQMINEPFCAC